MLAAGLAGSLAIGRTVKALWRIPQLQHWKKTWNAFQVEAHPTTQKLYTPERQVLRNSIHNMLSKHVVLNRYPHFLIWRSTWIQWQTCLCDVSTSPFHLSAHLSSLSKTFSMLILVSISRLIFWVICFLYLIYLCTCKVWLPVCLSVCLLACLSVIFASLSVCLSGCLPACLSVLSVCLSVSVSVWLSVCLSVCLFSSIFVCLCLSVFLFVLDSFCHSVCLSVSLFVCLFAWLAAWLFVFVFVFYLPVCFAGCLSVCLASQLSAVCLSVFLPRCLCCQCAWTGGLKFPFESPSSARKADPRTKSYVDFCRLHRMDPVRETCIG